MAAASVLGGCTEAEARERAALLDVESYAVPAGPLRHPRRRRHRQPHFMIVAGRRGRTVLIDGLGQATWKIVRQRGGVTLRIEPFTALSAGRAAGVTAEGARLLAFAAPGADPGDIHLVGPTCATGTQKSPRGAILVFRENSARHDPALFPRKPFQQHPGASPARRALHPA